MTQFFTLPVVGGVGGGDAKILSKTLKITIFANQNFILEGLNYILNLNKN